MESTVTLQFGALTKRIPFFDGRVHIPTIRETFELCVTVINGSLALADSEGFTHATFNSGDSSTSVALQLPYQVHCNPVHLSSWTLTVMSCQGILNVRPVVALHGQCKSGQHLWQPIADQCITTNHAPWMGVLCSHVVLILINPPVIQSC